LRTPSVVNLGLVSLARPSTEFVERPPVLVRGRRGPQQFAKSLPSEDSGEQPGEARRRPTYAWKRPVSYPWIYWTGEFMTLHGHSLKWGSNNED